MEKGEMIVVRGHGRIIKNLDKAGVIAEFRKAQAEGDRFASVTGAFAAGLDPAELEKEAGYHGASQTECEQLP